VIIMPIYDFNNDVKAAKAAKGANKGTKYVQEEVKAQAI